MGLLPSSHEKEPDHEHQQRGDRGKQQAPPGRAEDEERRPLAGGRASVLHAISSARASRMASSYALSSCPPGLALDAGPPADQAASGVPDGHTPCLIGERALGLLGDLLGGRHRNLPNSRARRLAAA
ncbi:hypothetical protein GCM10009548_68310 [Streptomyces malaysiensis subsp. malaysiensis]